MVAAQGTPCAAWQSGWPFWHIDVYGQPRVCGGRLAVQIFCSRLASSFADLTRCSGTSWGDTVMRRDADWEQRPNHDYHCERERNQ